MKWGNFLAVLVFLALGGLAHAACTDGSSFPVKDGSGTTNNFSVGSDANGNCYHFNAPTDAKGTLLTNKATFRIATGPVTSFATSATDWLVLSGSATKLVRVTNVTLCGTATSAATNDVLFVKRSAADSGGTTGTAPTIVPLQGETATASVTIYTANPTLGTAVGNVDAMKLNLGAVGSAGCMSFDFGTRNTEAVVLNGTAQQLAINFNSTSLPSGASIDARIEYTEE